MYHLKIHVISQHKLANHERVKEFDCNQCAFKANKLGNLRVHKQFVHEGIQYHCNQCKFKTKSRSYMSIHIRNRTHKTGLNYTDLDDASWEMSPQENDGGVILPSYKRESGRFACSECNTQFGTNKSLVRHKQSKHEGVRYNCDQCDSTFTQMHKVTIHKQSKHEGMRYKCDQCDRTFTDQGVNNKML